MGQMTITELDLEETCHHCDAGKIYAETKFGYSMSKFTTCSNCNGTGEVPTELGEQILMFIKRHALSLFGCFLLVSCASPSLYVRNKTEASVKVSCDSHVFSAFATVPPGEELDLKDLPDDFCTRPY